jgi:ribosomal protein S18 acetylase RimI-like enzyme
VAVVRLLWEDALFWGERDQGDAAYVHTLVVHRDAAGRGTGAQVLDWAASRAQRRGRHFLRLDCGEANQALIAYYRDNGFLQVGQVEVGGELMALLERKLDRP